ncbi:hypothetical protein IQ268_13030 [Oculatella sp. LEGE 06141]|nr:hypothetical protein [Oculatella sp. LEGE 06141]MBE9179487.1 hypothetical protein [Oculatella sp. LEGE 06141]
MVDYKPSSNHCVIEERTSGKNRQQEDALRIGLWQGTGLLGKPNPG